MKMKSEGIYTVSEKTKKQTNLYHLKKVFRALNSKEWYDFEEVVELFKNYELQRVPN